jgi:superfamily I DNA/RNA helicase
MWMNENNQLGLPYLLNEDGRPFEDLDEVSHALDTLLNNERKAYRDANAQAIAEADAPLLLIVAGPGAGKSHLFISRIEHWLSRGDSKPIYVATFVRKLINDLRADIDKRLSEQDRTLVSASTLHTLARSLLERSGGAAECQFREHIRIIDGYWAPIVWDDVLAFHPDLKKGEHGIKRLEEQFHIEELHASEDWEALRETYRNLCRFYNAIGFSYSIKLALDAVVEDPVLVEHSRWIIDEYQDFNPSEDHLLQVLMEGSDSVVTAGDDEQALYQTLKASDPAIIVGHYGDESYAKAMLPFCTRCSYYICRAASAFMAAHRGQDAIQKIYLPLEIDEAAERVHVIATAAPSGAVDYVSRFLEQRKDEYANYLERREAGEDTDPFLLVLSVSGGLTLTRKSDEDRELEALVRAYAERPARRSVAYSKLVAYATAGWYPGDNFALRKTLHYEGVSVSDVHELLEEAITNGRLLSEVVQGKLPDVLDRAQRASALLDAASDEEPVNVSELVDLLDLTEGESVLAKELIEYPIKKAHAREDEDDEATESVAAVDSVALMTITGSKGLSAHHVIVLGCDDINMSYLNSNPLPFFVALTRARRSLHLITATKANGAKEPHPFVLELPEKCCDYGVYKKGTHEVEPLATRADLCDRVATWAWQQKGGRARRRT